MGLRPSKVQKSTVTAGFRGSLAYVFAARRTLGQFEYYLTRALEEAYKVGQKPVGTDMIENVLAKDINGLEPRLTRQGYNAKVLADLLNVKPREIKSFLSGHLAPGRTQELQNELLAAGIPALAGSLFSPNVSRLGCFQAVERSRFAEPVSG